MEEGLEESVGVGQREEVTSWNNGRVQTKALAENVLLKSDGEQPVVLPDDRRGRHVGPCPDIAGLTEGDVGFVTRIGKDGGSVFGCEVMEEIRLERRLRSRIRRPRRRRFGR